MKKLFLSLAMVAALVGCATNEVIEVSQEAITFDEAFIDNSTRTAIDDSYVTSTLGEFQVYGTITNSENATANIFNGERVVKGNSLGVGTNWSYDSGNTQYWIPNNTYNFRAIAEGNVAGVTEVVALEENKYMATAINLLDASAQKDILFAQDMNVTYTSGEQQTVSFTFAHILSKVKFTFKNTISTDNGYGYQVKDISINGTANNGVYTIGAATPWAKGDATYNLSFGNAAATATEAGAEASEIGFGGKAESNWERLLIPSEEARNITFTAELYKDGVLIDTQNRAINTAAIELLPGQAYNFVISLGNPGEPIKFDVTKVTDWANAGDVNAGTIPTE